MEKTRVTWGGRREGVVKGWGYVSLRHQPMGFQLHRLQKAIGAETKCLIEP